MTTTEVRKPEPGYSPLRGDRRAGAITFLTLYLVLLCAIPSKLVVAALGAAGSPALLFGIAGALWWVWDRIHRTRAASAGRQPVRFAHGLFLAAMLCSFVAAMMRPISAAESSTAALSILALAGWTGVVLVANDGVASNSGFELLMRRIAFAGGVLAALGLIQFVTGESLVEYIDIPGLSVNQSLTGIYARQGFVRPSATAIHPIEFGAVLTMILPIALSIAMTDRSKSVARRWFAPVAIGLAIALSISRSAILCAMVGLAVLIAHWPTRARRAAIVSIGVLFVGVFLTVPGLLGSVTGLFSNVGSDPSASSRTGSYPIAFDFFARAPLFGHGFGTWLPAYRIFDNQYLLLFVETGAVGTVCTVGLVIAGIRAGNTAGRWGETAKLSQYGYALSASIAAGAAGLAMFDGFGFPMAAGLFFLLLGTAGALRRLTSPSQSQRLDGVAAPRARRRRLGRDANTAKRKQQDISVEP